MPTNREQELEQALRDCRDAINDTKRLNEDAIRDTVWHSPIETLVDRITAVLGDAT